MDSLINLLYAIRDLIVSIVYLGQLLHNLWLTLCQLIPRRKPQIGFSVPKTQPKRGQKWSKSYLTDPRNRELQHQLIGMLRGDIATAKRLLKQQRQQHPGRSDNWYLEKVIHDLERDRH